MFTGIIEGLGTIREIRSSGRGSRFFLDTEFVLDRTRIGDSIAVNGACLTVVSLKDRSFAADVSPETLSKTTFGSSRVGERVNIERALRLSDRLDGHLVSGHIDGTGKIASIKTIGEYLIVSVDVPEKLSRYMISKGSVAVDGVSLTINTCDRKTFDVSIIPHTGSLTTIGFKKVGDTVNIETDMIGKYVERFLMIPATDSREKSIGSGTIDLRFLEKTGFL